MFVSATGGLQLTNKIFKGSIVMSNCRQILCKQLVCKTPTIELIGRYSHTEYLYLIMIQTLLKDTNTTELSKENLALNY